MLYLAIKHLGNLRHLVQHLSWLAKASAPCVRFRAGSLPFLVLCCLLKAFSGQFITHCLLGQRCVKLSVQPCCAGNLLGWPTEPGQGSDLHQGQTAMLDM